MRWCTLLTTLSAGLLLPTASAFFTANGTDAFSRTGASGPYDLADVYPFYYSKTYIKSSTYANGGGDVLSRKDPGHDAAYTLKGDIPTYVIYYGSGHTDRQKTLINWFIDNVAKHPIWDIVNSYGGGNPYFAKAINLACTTSCTNPDLKGCYPCAFEQFDEALMFKHLLSEGIVPDIKIALYVFIMGTNVQYKFRQEGAANGLIMGSSQLCGTNDYANHQFKPGYPTISLQLLKSSTATCNVLRDVVNAAGGGYPNEYQVDNLVHVLFHELAEKILPLHRDSHYVQIADKCANRVVNVGLWGTTANVKIGTSTLTERFILPSLWDQRVKACSMGY